MVLRCPQCRTVLTVVGKFAVCPEHAVIDWESVVRSEADPGSLLEGEASSGALQRLVLERFPYPIAYGYARTLRPDNAATAVKNLLYTYTATLRFTTLVLLAQFLHSDAQNPRVAKAVRRLQMPHLNDWFNASLTLAKSLPLPRGRAPVPSFDEGGPFSEELVRAVVNFRRLRVGGQQCHQSLLMFRNRFDGHGATWSEEECRQQMEQPLALLERVLSRFECLGDLELLRRGPEGGVMRLVGAHPTLGEHATSHPGEPDRDAASEADTLVLDPELEDAFEASECVLRNADGELLLLDPLLLAPDATSAAEYPDEHVLFFDGHGPRRMSFVGVCTRSDRATPLNRYTRLLSAKNIDPRFSKRDLRPWLITEWARETTTVKVDNLRSVKYFPSFYQERLTRTAGPTGQVSARGVEDIITSWIADGEESALLVAAEAGAGKTSLLCHLARRQLIERVDRRNAPSPDCVLLVLGSSVRGGGASGGQLFERIRDGLGFVEGGLSGLSELLEGWEQVGEAEDLEHERRRLVLLVDAVNEAEDPKAVCVEVSELAAAAATANRKAGWNFVRLVLSVRLERIETLMHRWSLEHDTPFFQHPENFAHFRDERAQLAPFLTLRRFTRAEAARAYGRCARSLQRACPASWDALAPATQMLLTRPLMLYLFHRAFEDNPQPPAVGAEETLWDAFLDRTFDVRSGGAVIERLALELADACVERGVASIPADLAASWRAQWLNKLDNDPMRIAARLDPLERLSEAGLLSRGAGDAFDWISAPLAEHVFYRALCRRGGDVDLDAWLALPQSPHLEGAIVHAGVQLWEAGRHLELVAFLRAESSSEEADPLSPWVHERSRALLGEVLCRVAPRGTPEDVAEAVEAFRDALRGFIDHALLTLGEDASEAARLERLRVLKDVLTWDVWNTLRHRWGTMPVLHEVLPMSILLAERLVELQPSSIDALRELSLAFSWMAELLGRTQPRDARRWTERTLALRERLVEMDPTNADLRRDLSITMSRMGALSRSRTPDDARGWYERSLEITQALLESAPDDRRYLRDLQITCSSIGGILARRDPDAAARWHRRALELAQRLVQLEPGNRAYLRDLAIDYSRMGGLAERRDAAEAREWFERALEISERLASLEPDNTRFLRDLAITSSRLGALTRRSDPIRARAWYERALEISERLVLMEPDNTYFLRDLAQLHGRLGSLDRDHPERARVAYEKAYAITERLLQLEPDNHRDQHSFAITSTQLGELLFDSGDAEAARACFERALALTSALVEAQPRYTSYQRSLSISFNRMGDLAANEEPEIARDWYLKALEIRASLVEREPSNSAYLHSLARSHARLGELAAQHNRLEEARERYGEALAACEQLVAMETENVSFMAELGRVLGALAERAQPEDTELAFRYAHRAAEVLRQAVALNPDDVSTNRELIEALVRHGQNEEAGEVFIDALEADLLNLESFPEPVRRVLAEVHDVRVLLDAAANSEDDVSSESPA